MRKILAFALLGTPAVVFACTGVAEAAPVFGRQEPPNCTSFGTDNALNDALGTTGHDLNNGPIGCFTSKNHDNLAGASNSYMQGRDNNTGPARDIGGNQQGGNSSLYPGGTGGVNGRNQGGGTSSGGFSTATDPSGVQSSTGSYAGGSSLGSGLAAAGGGEINGGNGAGTSSSGNSGSGNGNSGGGANSGGNNHR